MACKKRAISPVAAESRGSRRPWAEKPEPTLYFVLLAVAIAYALLRQPTGGIRIDHFSWTARESNAAFVIRIQNRSTEERTAIVVITADRDVSGGHAELPASTVGRTNLEVTLRAHEEKWVNGSVKIWNPFRIVLSHYTRIKRPDKAGKASRTSVKPNPSS